MQANISKAQEDSIVSEYLYPVRTSANGRTELTKRTDLTKHRNIAFTCVTKPAAVKSLSQLPDFP